MWQAASVNPVEVGPIWLSYLPLTSDEVEAKAVHSQLTSLVEQSVAFDGPLLLSLSLPAVMYSVR